MTQLNHATYETELVVLKKWHRWLSEKRFSFTERKVLQKHFFSTDGLMTQLLWQRIIVQIVQMRVQLKYCGRKNRTKMCQIKLTNYAAQNKLKFSSAHLLCRLTEKY